MDMLLKKILMPFIIIGFLCSMSNEGRSAEGYSAPFGIAGCGLGSIIIDKKDKQSQIFASVINTYIGFVSSAITSGTSNCNYFNSTAQMEQKVYISSNLKSLEVEAARGHGMHLSALAQLFGCEEDTDLKVFEEFNKQKFGEIYVDADPDVVFQSIKDVSRNEKVIDHCPGLG